MTVRADESALRAWARALDDAGWTAFLLDADSRLVHATPEARAFFAAADDDALGLGLPIAEVLLKPAWTDVIDAASLDSLLRDLLPVFASAHPGGAQALTGVLPQRWRDVISAAQPQPQPTVLTGRFDYTGAGDPPYPVRFLVVALRNDGGAQVGSLVVSDFAAPPTQVALLVRGDRDMYARMAELVEPARHAAAIMFADLPASGDLARRLPTEAYFRLIRALTSRFDATVARECGVVGKHAGDGMTAFFLADQCGSDAAAAAAALRTAADLQAFAPEALAAEVPADAVGGGTRFDIGLHYGSGLYMGQLVPGSRLDVTALGDAVNECARLQQTASGGQVLASKAFVEAVDPACLTDHRVDAAGLVYRPLGDLPGVGEKALRDAGLVPVVELTLGA